MFSTRFQYKGPSQDPIPIADLEIILSQPVVGQVLAQASSRFIFSLILRDSLVQLVGFIFGTPYDNVHSTAKNGAEVETQLVGMASRVKVPHTPMVYQSVIPQPVVANLLCLLRSIRCWTDS